uniref:Uncharacterized protein n=1 Tax=Kalanchoe fedtschenkoi TaxID=63787 RepID=A0A7N0UKW2_KALFE
MGNCQAIDAAALVIQHPSGRIERLYWQVSASEVMKMNPGHYVSIIIPLPMSEEEEKSDQNPKTVRFTRVKLLRPSDTLNLGHAYRLVTSQEVMKVLRAKKQGKMKSRQQELDENMQTAQKMQERESQRSNPGVLNKDTGRERQRFRTPSASLAMAQSRSWRPSLQSIEEATIN